MSFYFLIFYAITVQIDASCQHYLLPSNRADMNFKIGRYLREISRQIKPQPTYIILVDDAIETDLPVMLFDTDKPLSELWKINRIPSLYVLISAPEPRKLESALRKLQTYPGFLEMANIVITLPHTPGQDLSKLLVDNVIFKVIFIVSETGETLNLSRNPIGNITESFNLTSIPKILRICYFETIPYTILNSQQKGLEMIILDLAARSTNIGLTFFRSKLGNCNSKGSSGNYQYLLNRTCDASLGAIPCLKNVINFDISTSYMDDGTAFVAPRLKCPRNIVPLLLNKKLMLSLLMLCSLLARLVRLLYVVLRSIEATALDTKRVLLLALVPLNLGTIVVLGFWHGQFYNGLVNYKQNCNAKNLNDVQRKGLFVGIEMFLFNDTLSKFFRDMDENSRIKYLSIDPDSTQLDPRKGHILRIDLFRYLVPEIYMKRGQESIFRLVQILDQIMFSTFLRKGYPFLKELNKGLGRLQQSGLVYYIRDRIFRHIRIKDLMSYSRLSMQFSPLTFEEIYWVLVLLSALWVSIISIFIAEILLKRK